MKVSLKLVISFVVIFLSVNLAFAAGEDNLVEPASPVLVDFCAFSKETDTDMNITIRENGVISGEFFMSQCGSGPLFGYAQIDLDSDGAWGGRLFIYTDILGGCLEPGAFYSIDVPDLIYRWHAEGEKSGAGLLELLDCGI